MAGIESPNNNEDASIDAEILQHNADDIGELRFSERSLRGATAIRIQKQLRGTVCPTNEWISDIIPNVRIEDCDELVKQAASSGHPNQKAIAVIFHPEDQESKSGHIHLYHTCNYINSTCRCVFRRGFNLKRRRPRCHTTVNSIEREYFQNWLKYFTTPPRRIAHLQIGRVSFGDEVRQIRDLRLSIGSKDNEADRSMEESQFSCEDTNWQGKEHREEYGINTTSSGRVAEIVNQGYEELSGSDFKPNLAVKKRVDNNEQIIKQLLRILSIPIESACSTNAWLENKYLSFYDKKNADYQIAVTQINRMISSMSYQEILSVHNADGCLRVYNARNNNHYFSLDESNTHIEQLLLHQYQTEDGVKAFVKRVYEICEKIIPKKNTMFVFGEYTCLLHKI